MATRKRAAKPDPGSQTDPEVTAFLRKLDHPLKEEFEAVRQLILGVNPAIREGIKWNSMSFRTSDYFATLNWRCRDSVQFIFHKGAKVKDNSTIETQIDDPRAMIKWLAKERCLVTVGAGRELAASKKAFESIVRQWIKQM